MLGLDNQTTLFERLWKIYNSTIGDQVYVFEDESAMQWVINAV